MAPRREVVANPAPCRHVRKQAGLELEQVVRRAKTLTGVDLTARTISHIESGARQPSARVFDALVTVYADALKADERDIAPVLGHALAHDEDACGECGARGWIVRFLGAARKAA